MTAAAEPELDRSAWDEQYVQGRWDYLRGPPEQTRYLAIADRIEARGAVRVLDLGCGQGLLLRRLEQEGFRGWYVGVDFSHRALTSCPRNRQGLVCADLYRLPLRGAFDVVVFSEVLYYLANPWTVIRRAHELLAPGGELMISLYRPPADRHPHWRARIISLAERLSALPGVATVTLTGGRRRWELYVLPYGAVQ